MNYGKRKPFVNDCMTRCAAKYFGLLPHRVPFFIGSKNWRRNFAAFFRRRGKSIKLYYYRKNGLPKRGIAFVVGLSPSSKAKKNKAHDGRNKHHVVLYKNGKPWYDPAYRKKMLKGRPRFMWLVKSVKRR